jgi:integral membrane sensor domain MASE1
MGRSGATESPLSGRLWPGWLLAAVLAVGDGGAVVVDGAGPLDAAHRVLGGARHLAAVLVVVVAAVVLGRLLPVVQRLQSQNAPSCNQLALGRVKARAKCM